MTLKRVLMIDDEESLGRLIKMNLGRISDFEVTLAFNGRDGLEIARDIKPDIILLDIMMPGMNGLEVLDRLKKDKNTMCIPVIMLTAKDDEETKARSVELYNEAYITKPVSSEALIAKIEEVLKRKK